MKKLLAIALVGVVVVGSTASASMWSPSPFYDEDAHSTLVYDNCPECRAAVAATHHANPAFDGADAGLQVMKPGLLGIKIGGAAAQGPGAAVASEHTGTPMNTALRYQHTEYEDTDADSDRYGATLRSAWDKDWITIDVAMPIDHLSFDGEFNDYDLTRVGLVVTPRLRLLRQESNVVDLSAGVSTYFMYTWFDENDAYNRLIETDNVSEDNAQHAGIGPLLTIEKDFELASVGVGAIYQRGFNLGGDEVFFDDEDDNRREDVGVGKIAANVGVPIGDSWLINGLATYTHVVDHYDDLDSDWFTLGLGASYVVNDKWTIDAMFDIDAGRDDVDSRWQVSLGAIWSF